MVILMNFPPPTEGIHHSEPNVTAHYKNKILGKGILYISESVLCWISSSGEGFSLQYPSIFMHAVSRDLTHFPHECLYLMIDGKISLVEEPSELSSALNNLSVGDGQGAVPANSSALNNSSVEDKQVVVQSESDEQVVVQSESDEQVAVEPDDEQVAVEPDDEQDYDEPTAEIRFVPDNTVMLDIMFQALSDCQTLNPEPGETDAGDAVIAPPFIIRDENGFSIEFEAGDAVIAPPFTISDENGFAIDFGECENIEEDDEEPMNEEQFEDAE